MKTLLDLQIKPQINHLVSSVAFSHSRHHSKASDDVALGHSIRQVVVVYVHWLILSSECVQKTESERTTQNYTKHSLKSEAHTFLNARRARYEEQHFLNEMAQQKQSKQSWCVIS